MGWLSRLKSNLSIKKITQNVLLPAIGAGAAGQAVSQPASTGTFQNVLPAGRENIFIFGGAALLVIILVVMMGRRKR